MIGDNKYLEVIKSIAKWIKNLPREKLHNSICLSYVNFKQLSVHNSNMLGASFLARYASIVKDDDAIELAKNAMRYSCSDQLENGAWYYGPTSNLRWIDNFHTGYNLDSLKYYIDHTGDEQFVDNLNRGYKFWKKHFFEESGLPFYYHDKKYPIDIQCASQAIDTFTFFSTHDPEALAMALKVAKWTIDNMQDKNDGHIYFRIHHFGYKSKVPLIHWAQATTFKALSFLLTKLS
jgi:rhamnogalacturonyl hydrolase YesR